MGPVILQYLRYMWQAHVRVVPCCALKRAIWVSLVRRRVLVFVIRVCILFFVAIVVIEFVLRVVELQDKSVQNTEARVAAQTWPCSNSDVAGISMKLRLKIDSRVPDMPLALPTVGSRLAKTLPATLAGTQNAGRRFWRHISKWEILQKNKRKSIRLQ